MYETPITLTPHHTIADALGLIHKRAHGAVVVVDDGGRPLGVFTEQDAAGSDRFTQLHVVMSRELMTVPDGTSARDAFDLLDVEPPLDGAGRRRRRAPRRRRHPQGGAALDDVPDPRSTPSGG